MTNYHSFLNPQASDSSLSTPSVSDEMLSIDEMQDILSESGYYALLSMINNYKGELLPRQLARKFRKDFKGIEQNLLLTCIETIVAGMDTNPNTASLSKRNAGLLVYVQGPTGPDAPVTEIALSDFVNANAWTGNWTEEDVDYTLLSEFFANQLKYFASRDLLCYSTLGHHITDLRDILADDGDYLRDVRELEPVLEKLKESSSGGEIVVHLTILAGGAIYAPIIDALKSGDVKYVDYEMREVVRKETLVFEGVAEARCEKFKGHKMFELFLEKMGLCGGGVEKVGADLLELTV